MVLVFILYIVIIITSILICMTLLSTIRLKIDNFEMGNIERISNVYRSREDILEKGEFRQSKNYRIIISLYFLNKLKWFSIKLDNKRLKNMYKKFKLEKIDLRKVEQEFKIEDLRQIKKLNPKLSYFNLQTRIGIENVILMSFIILFISTVISIALPYVIKKYDKDKYQYSILPVYINKNVFEIKFDCIIEIEIVHIISIIYYFVKKRRDKNHEQRTSNRGAYGYSYE